MLDYGLLQQLSVCPSTMQRYFKPHGKLSSSRDLVESHNEAFEFSYCEKPPLSGRANMLAPTVSRAQFLFVYWGSDAVLCCPSL